MEPLRSLSMQLEQTLAQFALPLFIARATPARLLDYRNASSRREFADSGGKIDMLVIHYKPEDAPACAAAETMKRLAARTHHERRRLFLMKGAERLEIRSCAFQGKIRTNYFHNIVRGGDLLDRFRRDRSHARLIIFTSFDS
jgi:hypothetical protein